MRQGYASSVPTLGFLAPDNIYSGQAVQGCKDPQDIISIKFGQNEPFRIAHRKQLGQHQFCQHLFRLEERARRFNTYSCMPNAVYSFLQLGLLH
jgi:hypothetical protein